jgi:hypothetical protein
MSTTKENKGDTPMFRLNQANKSRLERENERRFSSFAKYRLEIPTGCIVSALPFGRFDFAHTGGNTK